MADSIAPIIDIEKLSKKYRGTERYALKDLSIKIFPGEVYGFLGPNGAGKSTTIRTLLNFIQPSSGSAKIRGFDIVKDSLKIRQSVGYLSGDFAMYPKMTGRQLIDYVSDLQGNDNSAAIKDLEKKLNPELDKKIGDLSRGNKQKIGLLLAFMHKPKVLILDEPTSGLDPIVQEVFMELVTDAKKSGSAIFMSSHVLSEVQKLCDRVGIIKEGELVREDDISKMATEAAQTFDIVFAGKVPLAELKGVNGIKVESHNKDKVTIHIHGKLSGLFAVLAKHDVVKMDTRQLDLEESFMHFYTDGGKK